MNTDIILPAVLLGVVTLIVGVWAIFMRTSAMITQQIHPQAGQDVKQEKAYSQQSVIV